jgi:hypothetical protein
MATVENRGAMAVERIRRRKYDPSSVHVSVVSGLGTVTGVNLRTRMHQAAGVAALAAGTALSAMALAACGGGSSSNGEATKSAQQIVTDAQKATQAARSVHISGTVASDGEKVTLDVVDGRTSGGGRIGLDGATFQVVLAKQEVYLKANAATWSKVSKSASAGQLLGDRWVRTTSSNSDFGQIAEFLELPKLVGALKSSGSLTKEKAATVDGQKVVPIKDNGENQGTLNVAASGTPYIVSLQTGGSNTGTVHFNQYNKATIPAAPANSIDMDSLPST